MRDDPKTVQRSFRLARRTMELLDAAAEESGESRNALADRLLAEGVRMERHPLIRFRPSVGGRRQPILFGTRLYVYQVISTVRAGKGNVEEAASFLGIEPRLIRAAVGYYAEFSDEVDGDATFAAEIERNERARWDRSQRALA